MKRTWQIVVMLLACAVAPASAQAANHAKLRLSIYEPTGHRPDVRTGAFHAPGPWHLQYSFVCNMDLGMVGTDNIMSIRVVPGNSTIVNPYSGSLHVLSEYKTPNADARAGSHTYRKGGYYRLWVNMQRSCSWKIQVYG